MNTASRITSPALVALLENVIDYAGLFPPAKLDMPATVARYAAALTSSEAWMLERLIIPVSRLDEFEAAASALLPTGDADDPWPISALTVAAGDQGLGADLRRIAVFNDRHRDPANGFAVIDVIELAAATVPAIDAALDAIDEHLFPFFEIPHDRDPRGAIAALVGADAGAKVRTGGVRPDLYPRTADLARFIATCAAADVPFKATAGLHHPLRHHAPALGADEFGFLNVFVAATLALHHRLDADAIASILEERSLDAFTFTSDGLRWGELSATVGEIADARLSFAVSFGSCSIDEPRDDLRDLGLLAQRD